MFENFYERGIGSIPFHEAAVHLFELAVCAECNKRFVAARIMLKQGPESQKIEVLRQEQEQMGIAVLHVLQKGGQLRFCGNRNFSGDFVNSLFSAFRL
jgi:hypothetical protein